MNPIPAHIVKFQTPNNYLLDGIWFGSTKAEVGVIFIHGLSSSVFSQHKSMPVLSTGMVLFFNNRGHDQLTGIKQLKPTSEKGYEYIPGGMAHEVFVDCVDDIQGAVNFLKDNGVKNIFIVGHSTGCQKAIYYLSKSKDDSHIKGVALLCPISDYSFANYDNPKKLAKATQYAKEIVAKGKSGELIPDNIWDEDIVDAQRFLSLYTPESEEEIFTYSHPEDKPSTLQKVSLPLLLILAKHDEYGDRPMKDIEKWFKAEYRGVIESHIVDSIHNFSGDEDEVAGLISNWVSSLFRPS